MTAPARYADAARLQPMMRTLRRELHADPEIGLVLPRTQRRVVDALTGLDLPIQLGERVSSVVAFARGARPGPVVLLRADMDALPITERTDLSYASRVPGAMHACGHDLHTAMLVGAAHLLAAARDDLAGTVVLAWQPGEEGHDGMAAMLAEGLLTAGGEPPVATYGVHVLSGTVPCGVFSARAGASHASTSEFRITITGQGGHAAFPHTARDPIPVAAELVLALQTAVTRRFDVFDPVVATVGAIRAGDAANVIPDSAEVAGTVRCFSPGTADRAEYVITALAERIADGHGASASVEYARGYPPVVNDAAEVEHAHRTVADLFGDGRFVPMDNPIPAGDDYARLLERVPGCYLMLGATAVNRPDPPANHSAEVTFDDDVLADGAALLATLARTRLEATVRRD